MPIQIISKAQRHEERHYERSFEDRGRPGCGFGFPCDADGNVDTTGFSAAASENYRACMDGTLDVIDQGIRSWVNRWTEPARARCTCGHEISLAAFTNSCERCGRDYDQGGYLLAPRSQWGWDTDETPDEILAIGHHTS